MLSIQKNIKWGLVFATIICSQSSFAWKLGDPIGQVISDASKDIEKGVQNIGKAAADVITLGEAGRRRDQEDAEHQKQIAEEVQRSALALKNEKIKNIDNLIIEKNSFNKLIQESLIHFQLNEAYLKENIKSISAELKSYGSQSMQYQAAKELIVMQLKDLQVLVQKNTNEKLSATDNSNFQSAFNKKIYLFYNEINNIPQDSDVENFDSLVDQALEAGFAVLADIQQYIKNLQSQKVDIDKLIARLMEEKKQLDANK